MPEKKVPLPDEQGPPAVWLFQFQDFSLLLEEAFVRIKFYKLLHTEV